MLTAALALCSHVHYCLFAVEEAVVVLPARLQRNVPKASLFPLLRTIRSISSFKKSKSVLSRIDQRDFFHGFLPRGKRAAGGSRVRQMRGKPRRRRQAFCWVVDAVAVRYVLARRPVLQGCGKTDQEKELSKQRKNVAKLIEHKQVLPEGCNMQNSDFLFFCYFL